MKEKEQLSKGTTDTGQRKQDPEAAGVLLFRERTEAREDAGFAFT